MLFPGPVDRTCYKHCANPCYRASQGGISPSTGIDSRLCRTPLVCPNEKPVRLKQEREQTDDGHFSLFDGFEFGLGVA